jgi:RecA-family ATPase
MKTVTEILHEHGISLVPLSRDRRHYTTCPQCSAGRTRAHQSTKCLGITIDGKGVTFGCNHCGWTGGGYYNDNANGHDRTSPFTAIYNYIDESGELLFQVCRKPDKTFPQRRPDGRGGWIWKTGDVRKVLYRLPELIESVATDRIILIVEGEKDVESLRKLNVPATCNPGGASEPGKQTKWRAEYSETLRGADIVIVPDNDEPGRAHADAVARMCAGVAREIRLLDLAQHWPDCPKGGDVSDWIAAGHSREELDKLIEQATPYSPAQAEQHDGKASAESETFNAVELDQMEFPPVKSIVPGIFVEGLTLFCGKPKAGKSWLLLHASYAAASNGFTLGNIHCMEGNVLYCSLEDNKRRLKSRMRKLFGSQPRSPRLQFKVKMPRLAEGGIDMLREWCRSVPNPSMICIDTLAMVRMPNRKDQSMYDADYAAVVELRNLAHELRIAIVVVHHIRKMEADDPFDTISGTLGLTGCPDSLVILKRDSTGTMLLARGRDIEEVDKAITFNRDACTWHIEGDAAEIRRSAQQQKILDALREAEQGQTPTQIAAATGMKRVNIGLLLAKLVRDGMVQKIKYGKYEIVQAKAPEEEGDVDF